MYLDHKRVGNLAPSFDSWTMDVVNYRALVGGLSLIFAGSRNERGSLTGGVAPARRI